MICSGSAAGLAGFAGTENLSNIRSDTIYPDKVSGKPDNRPGRIPDMTKAGYQYPSIA